MNIKLGNRLQTVYNALTADGKCSVFADVGSDHAYLACAMALNGMASKCIASDINEQPLSKGRETALEAGLDIDFILSDGFKALEGLGIDKAAICGMGGELIASIIAKSEASKNALLVLQPMSKQEVLRAFLWDSGFEIISEDHCRDDGRYYAVLTAKYTGSNTAYSYSDLYLGKSRPMTAEYAGYVKNVLKAAKKRRLGVTETADIDGLINDCQTHLTNFSGATSD
ncbi:MAG: SAM-dependent methyltransferase [Clostridia bacterium]|nr:SAM-dependent methyltransferase [Clostridia bacterium]